MVESDGILPVVYGCRSCCTPLALREDLISKKYLAKTGPAFLFANVMNVAFGRKEEKQLMTGSYTITPIYCDNCGVELGWKYLRAYETVQKFKEGKFVVEKSRIIKQY